MGHVLSALTTQNLGKGSPMTGATIQTPTFSVVMATADRGKHILPSVLSVLAQDWPWFELIVVGDGCTDDTETALKETFGQRVRWINLPKRGGSQSFPNNAGISAAQGSHIAYLGHDDIWAPDHLSHLAALFMANENLHIAVSGCAFHLPSDAAPPFVTGLFDDPHAAGLHFFPPSSLAHILSLTDLIGPWCDPFSIRAPVDCDLLLRAHEAGCQFCSTGKITVHKFAAGHRYLSYLWHDTREQEAALKRLSCEDREEWAQSLLRSSQEAGRFMVMQYQDFSSFSKGDLARDSMARKGLRTEPTPLTGEHWILPQTLPSSFDWVANPQDGILWSDINPCPRILLSVTGPDEVLLVAEFAHPVLTGLSKVIGQANGQAVVFNMGPALPVGNHWSAFATARIRICQERPTALELWLDEGQVRKGGACGLGYGRLVILPFPDVQATRPAEGKNAQGLSAYAAGQNDIALAAFREAVVESPVHVAARANLALLLADRGEVAVAELHARIALALKPDNRSAWIALARLALAENARSKALYIAEQIGALREGGPVANQLRALIRPD